jgi:PPP family 3-phenylpropionic acid transporter
MAPFESPGGIVFIWALHGLTYIVFYLCLAEYVNANVIDELKSSGQAMNSIMIQGISRFFGGFFGGILASVISLKYVFVISSVICIVATAGFFMVMQKQKSTAHVIDSANGCR